MNHRRERVAQDLRDRLGRILALRVRDPRLRLLTVTDVELSPDFGVARVFYRTPGEPSDAEHALARARPFIRRCLAEGLPLRRVPELDFRIDRSIEHGERVEEILRELEQERSGGDTPEGASGEDDASKGGAA